MLFRSRRAGWLSAHQLGTYLLEKAKSHGVQLLTDRVINVSQYGGRIAEVELAEIGKISTNYFVNAAGPLIGNVASLLGVDLPVYSELHLKAAVHDTHQVVPRQAPLLIWNDAQYLPWSPDELEYLSSEEDQVWLSDEMPAGVHTRPEGGGESDIILMLWEYQEKILEPVFPPPVDELYPEIVLRGLVTMLPGMKQYLSKIPRPVLDGGYYTRTRENRPLIGPLPIEGAFIIGAFSGFGIMAACAAGDLLANHITQSQLPPYASSFLLVRYTDPNYQRTLAHWGDSGQL